jgi:hypothetical protein
MDRQLHDSLAYRLAAGLDDARDLLAGVDTARFGHERAPAFASTAAR